MSSTSLQPSIEEPVMTGKAVRRYFRQKENVFQVCGKLGAAPMQLQIQSY
jgi:hypothetical protein